jgi:hypothetical protein
MIYYKKGVGGLGGLPPKLFVFTTLWELLGVPPLSPLFSTFFLLSKIIKNNNNNNIIIT